MKKKIEISLDQPKEFIKKLNQHIDLLKKSAHESNGVIKANKELKSKFNPLFIPQICSIHIAKYHPELDQIKMIDFKPNTNLFALAITLIYKNNQREYYLINNLNIVKSLTELKITACQLELTEFSIVSGMIKHIDKTENSTAPKQYWDKNWDDPKNHGLYYDEINDPIVIDAYQKHVLSSLKKINDEIVILDLGAGKGRLAKKIITETLKAGLKIHYLFLEPSNMQLQQANKFLKDFEKTDNSKITYFPIKIDDLKLTHQVDCIISSGGPLNMDIVKQQQAIENVSKIESWLCPNGIFIGTGQTALVVKAKHFNKCGLELLSYATPCKIPEKLKENKFITLSVSKGSFFNHFQKYVCRKSDSKDNNAEISQPNIENTRFINNNNSN